MNTVWGWEVKGLANWRSLASSRSLDKKIIRVAGEFENGNTAFRFTQLGWQVRQTIIKNFPKIPLPAVEDSIKVDNSEDLNDDAAT